MKLYNIAKSLILEVASIDSIVRIPYPLINTLQDYKKNVELYKLYYGE